MVSHHIDHIQNYSHCLHISYILYIYYLSILLHCLYFTYCSFYLGSNTNTVGLFSFPCDWRITICMNCRGCPGWRGRRTLPRAVVAHWIIFLGFTAEILFHILVKKCEALLEWYSVANISVHIVLATIVYVAYVYYTC